MISNLLSSKGFITTNKHLALGIGLHEAIILGELCAEYNYNEENGSLTKDGYFYCTALKMQNETSLTAKEQSEPIKKLIELGFIKAKVMGQPAKRHFKIDQQSERNIMNFMKKPKFQFSQKVETSIDKKDKLDSTKRSTNKNTVNKNTNKNTEDMSFSAKTTSDPDELDGNDLHLQDAQSCLKENIPSETKSLGGGEKNKKVSKETSDEKEKIDKLIDFLNKKLGTDYKKATAPTRNKILKLLRNGYLGKDFSDVIQDRIKEWATDEKMKQYLTPATLFAEENFEKYLNLAKQAIPKSLPDNKDIAAGHLRKLNLVDKDQYPTLCDEDIFLLVENGNSWAKHEMNKRKDNQKWSL